MRPVKHGAHAVQRDAHPRSTAFAYLVHPSYGLKLMLACLLVPFNVAVTVAERELVIVPAAAQKVPLMDPALIVTLDGTVRTA